MAVPPDECRERFHGAVRTLSPMVRISYLLSEAEAEWKESKMSGPRPKLIFDSVNNLLNALETKSETDAKTFCCTAVSLILGYLDSNFDEMQLKPMAAWQAKARIVPAKAIDIKPLKKKAKEALSIQKKDAKPKESDLYNWKRSGSVNDVMVDHNFLDQLKTDVVHIPRWFIHPSHPGRVFWDVMCLCIVLIDSVVLPYQMSFFVNADEDEWFWFGTSVFSLDIVLNFFTGFIAGALDKDHGQLVTSHARIAKYYVRTWFLIDLISTIPWGVVFHALLDENSSGGGTRVVKITKVAKLARFMRLARMLKLLKLQSLWDSMENCIGSMFVVQVLNLVKVIAVVVYVCHWNACIWFIIGSQNSIFQIEEPDPDVFFPRWTTKKIVQTFINDVGDETTQTWRWNDREAKEQYIFCFYWTLGVMRTMPVEVYPVNIIERGYTLGFMFFAFSMFSICISRITQMYNKISTRRTEFEENIAAVRSYMHEHDIESSLQERIRTFLEYRFARRRIFAKEHNMFAELTETLKTELKCAQFVRTLQTLWIFHDLTNHELKPIVLICFLDDTAPGDLLAQQGTIASQASIIISGSLTLNDPEVIPMHVASFYERHRMIKKTQGRQQPKHSLCTVDADCLLFKTESLSEFSVWAEDFCELAVIEKDEFLRIRKQHPKINMHLEDLLKSAKGLQVLRSVRKRGEMAGLENGLNTEYITSKKKRTKGALLDEGEHCDGAVVQALG